MSGTNVIPLRRKPRSADIIEQAIASGKKLPLQVMFDTMQRLLDEAERLESSNNTDDALIARVARDRLFRVAEAVAPFVHPKIAATIIAGDEEGGPIRLAAGDRFARLTEGQATRFLEAINAGSMTIEDVDAALTD
jgi:hypothetical protein